mgnify:FL=1
MVKVLNLLKQPLSVNLSQDESIIFLSRETKELTIEQYNSEGLQNYIRKGILLVLEINE